MKKLGLMIAAAVAALPVAGANAQVTGTYNGNTYAYYQNAVSFATANANATALGGYLATITSQGEQDFLRALANSERAYIGGTDEGTEGLWHWIGGPEAGLTFYSSSGAPVDLSYSFWNSGEPNNSGSENALLINWNGSTGQWNDINGAAGYGYIVEFSANSAVPEPATWAMMMLGFGAMGAVVRRRPARLATA